MIGRKPKDHVRVQIKLDADLKRQAEEVREQGETLTGQIEDGLRRHIAARRRGGKSPPEGSV